MYSLHCTTILHYYTLGSHSIASALKHLRDGEADIMLAVSPTLLSTPYYVLTPYHIIHYILYVGRIRGKHHTSGLRWFLRTHSDGDQIQYPTRVRLPTFR
jgi:hypothetical protein